MSEKVLLVGNNIRNVAESAKKAGYEVYAITKFIDSDLILYCERVYEICDDLKRFVDELAERLNAKVVLGSGYECLKVKADVLGCDPKECEKVVDKLKFYKTLERAGIPHPEILSGNENVKAILKPRIGGGGEEIRFYNGKKSKGFIIQRYIDGIPCSVSLIASSKEITPISCNLILAGWNEMNANGFRYSGNITPFAIDSETRRELERIAVETVELFDLHGSIGVDFVLADKPYVLEINPRFQGSLDSIEWSCDVNIFKLHVMGCEGKRVEKPKIKRFAIRAILFANERTVIKRELTGNAFFADVPMAGAIYERGDPIVSILASGYSEEDVKKKAIERKKIFLNLAIR